MSRISPKNNQYSRVHRREFQRLRLLDGAQIAIGAASLGVPVAVTEEIWNLGTSLPGWHVFGIFLSSIAVISLYIFLHYHHKVEDSVTNQFFSRVALVYMVAFLVAASILFLIQKLPMDDWGVALARTILVAFPASFAATVVDSLD